MQRTNDFDTLAIKVVSSKIFRKFILIFLEISIKLLITYVNQLFPSPALQSDAVKQVAQLWKKSCELGDFKGLGHFEAQF